MGTTATAPAPQHMQALAHANRVRLARAGVKRQVADGEASVAQIVLDCPWEAESMTIADLLMSQHRWGRSRCRRFLTSISMTETKTIGSMTMRPRNELAAGRGGDQPETPARGAEDGGASASQLAKRAVRRRRSPAPRWRS